MIKKIIEKIKIVWPNLVYLKRGKSVRPLYRIFRPYYILTRGVLPVWLYAINRKACRLHEENKKPLNYLQQKLVGEMRANGVAMTHLDELFPGQNLLPKLQECAKGLIGSGQKREKGKIYITDLLEKMTTVDFENPFVKVALSPEVVSIANGYLGMQSKFFMHSLTLVSPVGDAKPISSQRWHRDPEDKKLFKIFIYLSDVDEEAGPFTYFMGSQAGGKWGRKFPQVPPQGRIDINGEVIQKLAGQDGIRVGTGKAGSVIFCDTAGIHRGGYAKSKERSMFTGGFCSSASLWLPKFLYPADSEIGKIEDPATRYALSPWFDRARGNAGVEMM